MNDLDKKIKKGWFTDKYFVRTRDILRKDGQNPNVIMQVFAKKRGILCGGIEAARIIRECGIRGDSLKIKTVEEGAGFKPWETVMTIEGDYTKFAHLETVYLGVLARCTSVATNVRNTVNAVSGKPVLFFPARFDHYLVQEVDGYAAFIGGASDVSTDANGFYFKKKGAGTIPHSLIAVYGGDTVKASRAFDKYVPENVKRIVLVDFDNNCVETSLKAARALKKKLFAVRLDTAENLVDLYLKKRGIDKKGVCGELVHAVRNELDKAGFNYVKIVISGGFSPSKLRGFVKAGVPFDIVGIGSYYYKKRIDFTADVVMVNGKPAGKVGRKYNPNPRLREI